MVPSAARGAMWRPVWRPGPRLGKQRPGAPHSSFPCVAAIMLTTSLHGGRGGKATTAKRHMPSDAEALALMVGCAMLWALRRSSDNPQFFTLVAFQ